MAIAYVASVYLGVPAGGGGGPPVATPQTVTISPTAGETLVLHVTLVGATPDSVASIGGTCGAFSLVTTKVSADGRSRSEVWATAVGGALAGTGVVVNLTTGGIADAGSFTVLRYSGVVLLGASSTATNTTANPSISQATVDNDNFIVALFGVADAGGGAGAAPTAGTGNARELHNAPSSGTRDCASGSTDNTAVAPGAVVNSITYVADSWTAIALELRSTTGTAPAATAFPRSENPGGRHPRDFAGPIELRRRALVFDPQAGTLYFQALSGAIAFAGALNNQTQRILTGQVSLSGTLNKVTARVLAGSITLAGALIRQTLRLLTGDIALSGTVSSSRVTFASTSGSMTLAGDLTKQTQRILTGAIAFAGNVSRLIARVLTGSLTLAGNLIRQTQRLLTGSLTLEGALNKLTSRVLAGSLALSGALTMARALALLGAIALSGVLTTLFTAGGGGPVTTTRKRIAAWLRRRGLI